MDNTQPTQYPPGGNLQGVNVDVSALVTALQLGNRNSMAIVNQLARRFASQVADGSVLASTYHAAGGVLISSAAGYLVSISVTSTAGGTGTGLCYDSASVANAGAANAFAIIPSSGFMTLNWPFQNGLVIQPSSQGSHTVSVAYVQPPTVQINVG